MIEKTGMSIEISIHDTHTGIDIMKIHNCLLTKKFQSTISIQVSTSWAQMVTKVNRISIHDTHTGIDELQAGNKQRSKSFQSTIPIQVSTFKKLKVEHIIVISIHDTHTGIDCSYQKECRQLQISIHDTHTGIDVRGLRCPLYYSNFNPRYPYRYRPQNCL